MSFIVAIAGRPNVGKSTLFNRLTGKRAALVDDTPGVTRDRRYGDAQLGPLHFKIIDTAGLEQAEKDTLQARMTAQSEAAMLEADVVMMIVDGRAGLTPADEHFARQIRKVKKPVVLVVNKVEGHKAAQVLGEFYKLGLGDPVAISAEHGEGMAELYDALARFEKNQQGEEEGNEEIDLENNGEKEEPSQPLSIAILGRPNAGKSTLFNRILGEERTLTGPEAGITRDAISVDCEFEGKHIKLIDTAGLRKKSNVIEKLEKLSVADALHAMQFAQIVVLVIDAQQPLEKQDNTIAALIEQEGRAMVLAVNKWDAIADKPAYLKAINERLEMVLPQVRGIPVVPISAQTGENVAALMKACFKAYAVWNKHIPTGELNRWLEAMITEHTPPLVNGRRIKIRYMTQKSARPPSFILFANLSEIPESYLRYLINGLRERFNLPGVPIRLKIKKNKNPYAGKP